MVFFVSDQQLNYLCFRFWIGMWVCLALLILVAFDLSALVRYITRFTEESFAMLIALIFIVEAFKKLVHILDKDPINLHPSVTPDYRCLCLPPSFNISDYNGTLANGTILLFNDTVDFEDYETALTEYGHQFGKYMQSTDAGYCMM